MRRTVESWLLPMLGAVLLLALPTAAVGYTATVVWTFTAGERSIAKVGYCRTTYNSKGSSTTCPARWTDNAGRQHRTDNVTGADTSEATEHHAVRSGPLGVYLDKTSVLLPRAIIGGGLSVVTLLPGLMLLVAVRRTHRFGRVLLGRGSTDSRLLRFTDTEATDTRGETKLTIRQNPDGSLALTRSSRSSPTLTVTPDPGNPRAFDVTGSDGVHIGRVERGPGPKVTADLRDDYGVLVARAETGLRPGYRFCTPAGTLIAEAGLYRKQLLLRIEPPHDTPTDRLLWAFGAVHERVLAAPSRPVEKPVPAPRLPRASRQSESASESHYRFAIVRRGYDPAQVNAFITEAAAGQLPPNPAEFTIVRRGYDQQQVDDYLDSLQHERPA